MAIDEEDERRRKEKHHAEREKSVIPFMKTSPSLHLSLIRRMCHAGFVWKFIPSLAVLLALLSSCGGGGTPPSVAIITPANDAMVSGTTAVQVTLADDQASGEISVYARERGSAEEGRLLGSVNSSPYIVSWNTASLPAGDRLELYAKATVKGNVGSSTPVRVVIQNASAPTLAYLVAYNLPAGLTGLGNKNAPKLPGGVDVTKLRPGLNSPVTLKPAALRPQASDAPTPDRQLAVEWAWTPVDGAAGYRVLLAKSGAAGPYEAVRSQAASAGSVALEKYSQFLTDENVGGKVYGALRGLSGDGTESATSNAGKATFLDSQQIASPADGGAVSDGRPILTWNSLPGASGSLYFLCDRPCTADGSKFVWTNYPTYTAAQSAVYPTSQSPLPSGTYYWWVAGVRQENGQTVSLSYSEQRRLVVP